MTGRRGQPAPRQLALFAAVCAALCAAVAVGWTFGLQAASAAQPCTIVGGNLQGNSPTHEGDPILATAQLSGLGCRNVTGAWIEFDANGQSVDHQDVTAAKAYYSVLRATVGHTVVSAVLWNGDSLVLGAIDVQGSGTGGGGTPTPTLTHTTTVPAPPRTSAGATPTGTTSRSGAHPSSSASRAKLVPVVVLPSFGGDDVSPSDTPTPSASTSPPNAESGVAYKVGVIHGDGSVDPIPAGLLIATVVVIGGLLGAAAHFVWAHNREARGE